MAVDPEASRPEAIRRRVVIAGRVQGVGFRVSCARQATTVGVTGAVRNLPDGRVEAVFEGRPDRVEQLITWCRRGPNAARVTRIQVTEEPATGAIEFRIA
jgi:acylphosphatase